MIANRMELRAKYPSMIIKVARSKEDERLYEHAEWINSRRGN